MKSLIKMTWMETKLFLREPINAFFTLIFPVMMLLIFGSIYGSQPMPGGGSSADAVSNLIPAFTAMVIGITGMMPVTITLANNRENGILRRLQTTPVHPLVVMASQVIVVFVMTCLGVLLLFAAGRILYDVSYVGNIFSIVAGFILACLSFFGVGFILAGIMPTARSAQIVTMVLLYPMLILSGAAWPRELMPAAVEKISAFLPLTYVVNLLRGLWIGDSWRVHLLDVGILLFILTAGVLISVRLFRWE